MSKSNRTFERGDIVRVKLNAKTSYDDIKGGTFRVMCKCDGCDGSVEIKMNNGGTTCLSHKDVEKVLVKYDKNKKVIV